MIDTKLHDMMIASGFWEYCQKAGIDKDSLDGKNTEELFNQVRRDARERTLKRIGRI